MRNSYEVRQDGKAWVAELLGAGGIEAKIYAVSEKQAHFLAQQEWPQAVSPGKYNKAKDAEYYSREGFAYRAKMDKSGDRK